MNAIEITGLTKTYLGGVRALDALSLSVAAGEIVGLVGPNGAGKSTTINILAGLLKSDCGDVSILGESFNPDSVLLKRRMGFLLERPMYFEKLSAHEYLRFVGIMYMMSREEADNRACELLDYLDMTDCGSRLAETYSAGTKKKVSLAAAIIHNPDLVILDEPFDGVDPISSLRMKGACKAMAAHGATVLVSSHQLDTVEKLCDSVVIMDKGRSLVQAAISDLRANIATATPHGDRSALEEIFLRVVANGHAFSGKDELSWLRR